MGLCLALCLVYYDVLKPMFYYTEFISIIGCEMFKFVENHTNNEALGQKHWVSCAKLLTDIVVWGQNVKEWERGMFSDCSLHCQSRAACSHKGAALAWTHSCGTWPRGRLSPGACLSTPGSRRWGQPSGTALEEGLCWNKKLCVLSLRKLKSVCLRDTMTDGIVT